MGGPSDLAWRANEGSSEVTSVERLRLAAGVKAAWIQSAAARSSEGDAAGSTTWKRGTITALEQRGRA